MTEKEISDRIEKLAGACTRVSVVILAGQSSWPTGMPVLPHWVVTAAMYFALGGTLIHLFSESLAGIVAIWLPPAKTETPPETKTTP